MQEKKKLSLIAKIGVGFIIGLILGFIIGPMAPNSPFIADIVIPLLQLVGNIFLALLKMLIVPLVFFTLVAGVTSMESPDSLKKIGGFIVAFYLLSSLVFAAVGTAVALALRPGRGAEGVLGSVVKEVTVGTYSAIDTILNWIPENPVASMANMNMIQVIFFALITGVALLHLKDRVPVAIAFGGPGAVLWMWATALIGSATKFTEVVLGLYYREKNSEGYYVGGPMYYLSKGLKNKRLGSSMAFTYAFGTMVVIFFSVAAQSVSATQTVEVLGVAPWLAGVSLMLLVGVVVNNAILLVDFINQLRASGDDKITAVLKAGPLRLRAILMTTVSTMIGSLPVALALSEGGEVRQPMSVAVIGGLFTSTLLTLLVIPVVYLILDDLMDKVHVKIRRYNAYRRLKQQGGRA